MSDRQLSCHNMQIGPSSMVYACMKELYIYLLYFFCIDDIYIGMKSMQLIPKFKSYICHKTVYLHRSAFQLESDIAPKKIAIDSILIFQLKNRNLSSNLLIILVKYTLFLVIYNIMAIIRTGKQFFQVCITLCKCT
jgi:hypothetical protein